MKTIILNILFTLAFSTSYALDSSQNQLPRFSYDYAGVCDDRAICRSHLQKIQQQKIIPITYSACSYTFSDLAETQEKTYSDLYTLLSECSGCFYVDFYFKETASGYFNTQILNQVGNYRMGNNIWITNFNITPNNELLTLELTRYYFLLPFGSSVIEHIKEIPILNTPHTVFLKSIDEIKNFPFKVKKDMLSEKFSIRTRHDF